ncbi:MAG TPA: tetratricopeptide repeat protein [Bacteroidales bacterium]|nr:tetratricopeptide repeat protein [Bacteroidales bacterium]
MIRYLVLLVVLTLSSFGLQVYGSADDYDQCLYMAFVSGNMADWEKVLDEFEALATKSPIAANRFKLLHAQYGYIGYLLGVNQTAKAKRLIEKAEKQANILAGISTYQSTAKAMQAALLAYRISISPYKAPFLGPKSASLIDEALTLSPTNYYALIEKGNARHYAPVIVGGNPTEAVELYRKAIELIEKEYPTGKPKTWWYINTYTQMGLAAQKAGNKNLAKKIYQTILTIEPNYQWVKEELLPKV